VNLPESIREALEQHGGIPTQRIVVGVSGGLDSVALLRALSQLAIPCTVAHLNHQLRGKEAEADEQFVRELAAELDLPFSSKSVDVKALAKQEGISLEMAARNARLAFFAEFEHSIIMLAHHADDQVETFFLRLARGAGTDGLGGISFSQVLKKVHILRPMLGISRAEIRKWMEENHFAWREDASNQEDTFLRNRIRHQLLPLFEETLNPRFRSTLLRTMDILRAERDWMDELTKKIPVEEWLNQPLAAQRRILRRWLFENGVGEVSFESVETMLSLMKKREGTTFYPLNAQQQIIIEYGQPRLSSSTSPSDPRWRLEIKKGVGWEKEPSNALGIFPAKAAFNLQKIGESPLKVRVWQAGDRIAPLGMKGHRKIQDILTDQKIPKTQRASIPVVLCRGEIIWLPGYRISRDWAVCSPQDPSIQVRLERI
jgi:tRNA(Ile)-lysidine synthase